MSVIAVDIGSSRIKALLASWDGRVVEICSAPTPRLAHAAGQLAYPVDVVFEVMQRLVADLTQSHPAEPVDTIVFSCLGTAMAPVDREDRPIGPAYSPADSRPLTGPGLDETVALSLAELRLRTGSDPQVASFLRHFIWYRDSQPAVLGKVVRFRSLRGYVVQQLCHADAEDPSWASRTMLMDLESDMWSETILDAAGLPIKLLPQIQPSTMSWAVDPEAGARIGLERGARVVLGGMDNCCSLLGATVPGNGGLAIIVGTFEHVTGSGDLDLARAAAAAGDGIVHRFLLPDQFIAMTREPIGILLAAVARESGIELMQLLDGVSDQPTGSELELDHRVVLDALRSGTPPVTVVQGLLETAATILKRFVDAWEAVERPRSDIAIAGGGAAHDNLLQLKANVLGRRISTLELEEAAGIGALRLAAISVKGASPLEASELFDNPDARTWAPHA